MSTSRAAVVLKDVFGYDKFLPLQEEIVSAILRKQDSLVILPTGGGKSLCYQIPAILFPGLTLVVSPLISLMLDQVQQLKALGVSADFLNSSLSAEDYRQVLDRIHRSELKMLYLAPETLMKSEIQRMLQQVNVDCLAIDEAHCISEWGHDFRPEYRQLVQVRRSFPGAVCVALTATATQQVQQDIRKNLAFDNGRVFQSSFDRKNLFLQVEERKSGEDQLLSFVRDFSGQPGIIYCFSRQKVDEVSAILAAESFQVRPYHAGLSSNDRSENQELFIRDDVQIIVATIAFGMGINKPNVRFVVHYDLPKNLESYYQQIGRAGRDGLESHCLLLYKQEDRKKLSYFIGQIEDLNLQRIANEHLNKMVDYASSFECRRQHLLYYFGEVYPHENCSTCDNCASRLHTSRDITVEAQKFLSCMARTDQRFGMTHIIDILRGSESPKVFETEHQNLSTFGIGANYSYEQWSHLYSQFLNQGLIIKDEESNTLRLSEQTEALFKGDLKVNGTLLVTEKSKKKKSPGQSDDVRAVLVKLRKKRKELAKIENVPPHVIFGDVTLIEMARKIPSTRMDLLAISGMGLSKLEKYGEAFLKALHGEDQDFDDFSKKNETPNEPKTKQVGDRFNEGLGLGGLQDRFNLKPTAIIPHLISYQDEYQLLDKLLLEQAMNLDESLRGRVSGLIDSLGTGHLQEIQQELGGQVTMNQLKLMVLWKG